MNLRRIVRTLFHDNKKVLQLKTRMNITIIAQLKQSKANLAVSKQAKQKFKFFKLKKGQYFFLWGLGCHNSQKK